MPSQWIMLGYLLGGVPAIGAEIPATPVFQVLDVDAGLPSSQIHALLADSLGRLWIGSGNGLVRHDGHTIQVFRSHPGHEHAPSGASVEAMSLDAAGQLWVATQGGGLARHRPHRDDFERIELLDHAQRREIQIWALAASELGLWVAGRGVGLLELDTSGRELRRLQAADGPFDVTDLLVDGGGGLWIIDLRQRLFHLGLGATSLSQVAAGTQAQGLGHGRDGASLSTRDGRICRLAQGQVHSCEPLPLLALPGRARLILGDGESEWIGGVGELLHRRDERSRRHAFRPGLLGGIPNHAFWTGLRDRDGGIWLGSTGGGLLHRPAHAAGFRVWQPDDRQLRGGRVRGVAKAMDGSVWIGTMDAGLFRLDPGSGAIHAIEVPGISFIRAWAVLPEGPELLWLGHQAGVHLLRRQADGTVATLRAWTGEELAGPMVDLLHRLDDGRVLAASMGGGLSLLDPGTQELRRYAFGEGVLRGSELQMLARGIDGRVWIAGDRGWYAWDPGCECLEELLGGVRVDAFALAPDSQVYALVDGRLVLYAWRGALFQVASFAPRSLDSVQSVGGMTWSMESLWLAGPQGLFRYRPELDQIDAWDRRDGLPTREFSDRPFWKDDDGKLWIGSEAGLVAVDPSAFEGPQRTSSLRLDGVWASSADGLRELDPSLPLRIAAEDREWRLRLRIDSLVRAQAQRFSVRLEGWDEDWPPASVQPERVFGGLPAGRYALHLRAWDGFGRAASSPSPLAVLVSPPWWRTAWAWLAYSLALLALFMLALRMQRRRIAMQRALEQARERSAFAQRLVDEKDALVAELSHEIRNPLNGMLGMGHLLRGTRLDARQQELLALLEQAGGNLRGLLDAVLDWSRIEAGRVELEQEVIDPGAVLAPLLERYRLLAAGKGLRWQCVTVPDALLRADALRLGQIVENLLANALKFTPSGGIQVAACMATPDCWRLSVCDNGPGIADDDLARLFQPFERASGGRCAPGTGLGLAISRRLAERMGGQLRARSPAGGGACFELSLPVVRSATPAPMEAPGSTDRRQPTIPPGLRVLVVEDDLAGREALVGQLGAWQAVVTASTDAMDALLQLRQASFDALLIDRDLPGMDGLELACTVLGMELRPRPRLIAVTGRASPEDRRLALRAGFDAHLAKPLDWQSLARELSACGEPR